MSNEFSVIPVAIVVSAPSAAALDALEGESHDAESLARLGITLKEITFGAPEDTEERKN
jgi:hypothetical protein